MKGNLGEMNVLLDLIICCVICELMCDLRCIWVPCVGQGPSYISCG